MSIQDERDELRRRIDAVMACGPYLTEAPEYHRGYNNCLASVKALLAPPKEPRFTVVEGAGSCEVWDTNASDCIASFYGLDAERHAREFADKLNAEEDGR